MKKTLIQAVLIPLAVIGISVNVCAQTSVSESQSTNYNRARWNPIHFKPAIMAATNEQCLICHMEILDKVPRKTSPAGLTIKNSLAWYQTLSTYEGDQDTFHRRHIMSNYSKRIMNLGCTTCHQGNDPREEVPNSSSTTQEGLTMRKSVDPYICAMCHAQYNFTKMGVPGPWPDNSTLFADTCLTCHVAIKLERHHGISFLNAEGIEELAKKDSNVCYGCHGGRAWYRINFPYTEKKWPGLGDVPIGAESKYSKISSKGAN